MYFCQYQIMMISICSAMTYVTAEESRQMYREWGGVNGNLNRLKTQEMGALSMTASV